MKKLVKSYWAQVCIHGEIRGKCDTCIGEMESRKADQHHESRKDSILMVNKRLKQLTSINDKTKSHTNKKTCSTNDDKKERALFAIMKNSLCSCRHRPESRNDWSFFPAGSGNSSATYRCPMCKKIIMYVTKQLPVK